MHVANLNPNYITRESVPDEVIEREREIQKKRVMEEGKPEHIAERIVSGRMNKFYEEQVFMEQTFIKDDSRTITHLLEESGNLNVQDLVCFPSR